MAGSGGLILERNGQRYSQVEFLAGADEKRHRPISTCSLSGSISRQRLRSALEANAGAKRQMVNGHTRSQRLGGQRW